VRVESVRSDLEPQEGFPVQDIRRTTLVYKDPKHHEVCNNNGDDHGIVLVDRVDALEVPICKGDRRETTL